MAEMRELEPAVGGVLPTYVFRARFECGVCGPTNRVVSAPGGDLVCVVCNSRAAFELIEQAMNPQ